MREKKRNFIILVAFAAVFSSILMVSFVENKSTEVVSAAELSSSETTLSAELGSDLETSFVSSDLNNIDLQAADLEEQAEEELVTENNSDVAADLPVYTVTKFETAVTLYASDTVNVRAGAGTEYNRLGKASWGTPVLVTGVTDNGWYEIAYNEAVGFIRGDYIVAEMPGIPYLFVGDSRTVQLQMAVGSIDKAYVAKVGEGYSYFRDVALAAIPQYAGNGTKMIINFGVNDLANAKKYVQLVNANIDTWINAGVTVYYSAVTPVGSNASVSNAQIEAFNATLQEGLDERVHWIDSYSYLMQTGFSSSDGLHYNKDTYRNLYSYYIAVLNQ